MIVKHAGDMAQCLILFIIGNLSDKVRRLFMRPGKMIIDLICISKNDFLYVQRELYHYTMRIIRKSTCNHKLMDISNNL